MRYKFFNWIAEVDTDESWFTYSREDNKGNSISILCSNDGEQSGFYYSGYLLHISLIDWFWEISFITNSEDLIRLPILWRYLNTISIRCFYYPRFKEISLDLECLNLEYQGVKRSIKLKM